MLKISKKQTARSIHRALLLGLCLSLSACVTIRGATYPPNFVYLENEEVHKSMKKMAVSIERLDQFLQQKSTPEGSKRSDVRQELENLWQATEGLSGGAFTSNHRIVTYNIENFRRDVRSAQDGVENTEPNYYPASQLVSKCLDCHVKNVSDWGDF